MAKPWGICGTTSGKGEKACASSSLSLLASLRPSSSRLTLSPSPARRPQGLRLLAQGQVVAAQALRPRPHVDLLLEQGPAPNYHLLFNQEARPPFLLLELEALAPAFLLGVALEAAQADDLLVQAGLPAGLPDLAPRLRSVRPLFLSLCAPSPVADASPSRLAASPLPPIVPALFLFLDTLRALPPSSSVSPSYPSLFVPSVSLEKHIAPPSLLPLD